MSRTSATPPGTSTTGAAAGLRRCWDATARWWTPVRRSRGRCCWYGWADELDDRAAGGPAPSGQDRSFVSGARILTIGIASTGISTFLSLATASHVLTPAAYSRISLCWAIMFVILSVIYRPIEQLLSRTIADRRARGLQGHSLRVPALIQLSFATIFLVVALALRPQIQNGMFDGSGALYWVLVIGVLAYAASYFARGWLAGNQRFALYGGLVFLESTSRFIPALVVAVGIA